MESNDLKSTIWKNKTTGIFLDVLEDDNHFIKVKYRRKWAKSCWIERNTLVSEWEQVVKITIRDIPQWLYQAIKRRANDNRRSMNQEIITLLEPYFAFVIPKDKDSYAKKPNSTPDSDIQDTQSQCMAQRDFRPCPIKEWLTRDDKCPGFLGEKQRQRYELRVKGIPEEKWPVNIWPKRNEKR